MNTKEFGESTVSKILELVENSSMKKAKVENFISKFARYYTPAGCCSALALAIIPPVLRMLFGHPADFADWIIRALTFLVISCPCALVISIPLSFFGGIGGASSCGILVKGANYLEALAKTKYVVFDKTGTLTKGVFRVTEVVPAKQTMKHLLRYAAYAESYSNHPISKSLKEAYGEDIDYSEDKNSYTIYTNEDSSDGMYVNSYINAYLKGYNDYLKELYLIGEDRHEDNNSRCR